MRGGNSAQSARALLRVSSASDCGTESSTRQHRLARWRYRFPPVPSGSHAGVEIAMRGEITYRAAVAAGRRPSAPAINCIARTFGAPLTSPYSYRRGKRAGRRDRGAATNNAGDQVHHVRVTVNFCKTAT